MTVKRLAAAFLLAVAAASGHPWYPMGLTGKAVLSIQARGDMDSVYAAADDGLYVAEFSNWHKVYDYGSHSELRACVRVLDHNVYLAWGWGSRSDGLWLRPAHADTWQVMNWLLYASLVEVGERGDVIFLGSDTLNPGLWRSDDSGATWVRSDSGLPDTDLRCLAVSQLDSLFLFCGTKAHGLFRSTDGGRFWTSVWPASTDDVRDVEFSPWPRDSIVMTAVGGTGPRCGVWCSTDRGATWSRDLAVPEASCLVVWFLTEAAAGFQGDSGVYWGFDGNWYPECWGLGNHMVYCLSGGREVPWAGTADGVWQADWMPGVEERTTPYAGRLRYGVEPGASGTMLFDATGRRVTGAGRLKPGVYYGITKGQSHKLVIIR